MKIPYSYFVLLTVALVVALPGAATSLAAPVFEQSDIFVGGEGGYHTYRIPAMAVMPSGTVLAFAEGRKTSPSDAGDIDLVMRRSTDNGRTWSPLQVVHEEGDTAAITIGNPTPVVDHTTGKVHLLFSRNNERMFVMTISDDGQTFDAPVEISAVAENFNYDWTRLGPGPTAGIQTSAGRLVAPVWLNKQIGDPDEYRAGAIYSDDHGATWQAGEVVPINPTVRGTNESAIVELADGRLYMTERTFAGPPARSKSFSTDGGQTWSEAELEPGINPTMSPIKTSIMRYSTTADSDKNRLLYSATAAPDRNHMTVWLSEDEAGTWPISKEIYHGPSGYSELAVVANKTVLALYERGQWYHEKITLARFNLEWLNPLDHAFNGDFEDTAGWGDVGTTEFPAQWTPTGERKNAAARQTGANAIGGSGTSAYLPAFLTSDDSLRREILQSDSSDTAGSSWQVAFDVASEDPGDGDQRSLSAGLGHGDGQITLRIVDADNDGNGDVQHYDDGWKPIPALDGSITFDGDVQILPQTNNIRIYGHYDQETPAYDIIVVNAAGETFSATSLTGWLSSAPQPGDRFEHVSFNTFNSSGDYTIDNFVLTSDIPIPGDANGDGKVDAADAAILAANWQISTGANWENGDFNSDGKVDNADATILAANWQQGVTGHTVSAPEAATLTLLLAGVLSLRCFGLIR